MNGYISTVRPGFQDSCQHSETHYPQEKLLETAWNCKRYITFSKLKPLLNTVSWCSNPPKIPDNSHPFYHQWYCGTLSKAPDRTAVLASLPSPNSPRLGEWTPRRCGHFLPLHPGWCLMSWGRERRGIFPFVCFFVVGAFEAKLKIVFCSEKVFEFQNIGWFGPGPIFRSVLMSAIYNWWA